ncbi:phosphodiester glycosidase family protein [Deinococcus maricopensis]|uniref:Phosphodiester glycosidase domain-containing protein n=1 Tax=Deinococcus maricopensis (strain DSM 21211 / LMG 22137 / NRRL B-23946 / LB-34) TaxID=709986 RepID=E8UB65_DEIML|nr:phosphodiester glycosidase family protein [Deinococcus maricopensis]ADV68304.1 Protein of unknown function DUF2233, periplasmic [Deinococcus maricopensis DSM 21211]
MKRAALPALLLLSACAPRADALTFTSLTYRGTPYTVVGVDPRRDRLQLHWRGPNGEVYGTFGAVRDALKARGERLLFATNSGIYAPGLRPLGLHVENGRTLVPINNARSGGNFALLPNGVFWLKGARAGVTETGAFKRANLQPTYATQSGPLLVQGGRLHPEFNARSTSFKVRSGVGVCTDGTVKFVISDAPVNFYAFAVFFRDRLRCPDALYLDGSISAMDAPKLNRNDQLVAFAGIWTVTAR